MLKFNRNNVCHGVATFVNDHCVFRYSDINECTVYNVNTERLKVDESSENSVVALPSGPHKQETTINTSQVWTVRSV